MTKTFIIASLLCFLSITGAYSQASSEGMAVFDFEIEKFISGKQRNQYKEIIIRIKPNQLTYSGKWKEKVKYQILNDSVIRQTLQGNKHYGLVSNGEIIPIDYNQKTGTIIKRDKTESDSSSYKISKTRWINGKDTSFTYGVKTLDSTKAVSKIHYKNYYVSPITPPLYTESEIFADTLYHIASYTLKDKNWVLNNEWTRTRRKKDNFIEEITKAKTVDEAGKEKTVTQYTKIYMAYDDSGRLTSIYKEDYCDDMKAVCDKHFMAIEYKNR